MNHCKYVIAPFMDVDVMEALFSSAFSLFSNTRHTKNPFKRLSGGRLQCSLIQKYSPTLAEIPFANLYTPRDVLGNQIAYILKRIYLQTLRVKSKPTFSYGDWFLPFMDSEINDLKTYLHGIYDLELMRNDFDQNSHMTHEGYWHKYTNPIMLNLYTKRFNQ